MGAIELSEEHVRAAASGDTGAIGLIYAQLSPQVLGYLRAHQVPEAEDACSDVFLQLLPQLPRLEGGVEGLRKLTFTMARYRMIDAARKKGRRGTPLPYDPAADPRSTDSAEDDAQALAALARVQGALALLPDDQRDVLTMRVVADLSLEQVAAVIGRSTGAVKQLQRRGLKTLRAAVEDGRVTL